MRLTDSLGPEIDLDYDLDADVHMTTVNSAVQVEGGTGNDYIDASQMRFYETTLLGQGGDDLLRGGARADILDGGPGFDTAEIRLNTGDASISIEKPLFSRGAFHDHAGRTLAPNG